MASRCEICWLYLQVYILYNMHTQCSCTTSSLLDIWYIIFKNDGILSILSCGECRKWRNKRVECHLLHFHWAIVEGDRAIEDSVARWRLTCLIHHIHCGPRALQVRVCTNNILWFTALQLQWKKYVLFEYFYLCGKSVKCSHFCGRAVKPNYCLNTKFR